MRFVFSISRKRYKFLLETCEADSLNAINLGSAASMVEGGWKIDGFDNYASTHSGVVDQCGGGKSYFAWHDYDKVGKMLLTVPSGVKLLSITFASCWTTANSPVVVYKNDEEQKRAENGETKIANMMVSAGDVIKIQDEGDNSVVQIIKIEASCDVPSTSFVFYKFVIEISGFSSIKSGSIFYVISMLLCSDKFARVG